MMANTLPDIAARRRAATELDRNFIVEAGAGTGKTRLLVDRIEHLIASGTVPLRTIVAITFTEKAAADLRVHIRLRIEARLRNGRAAAPAFGAALEDLEAAPVSTIHAFAADLLRERPVEAGVDPGFTVADELTASLLRSEAWDRWLEEQREAGEGGLREAIDVGVALRHLRALGDALLRHRDLIVDEVERGSALPDPLEWLAEAKRVIRDSIAVIDRHCHDLADNGVADLRALGQGLDVFARLSAIEVRRAILGGLKLRIRGNQTNWAPRALGEIKDRLRRCEDDLEALRTAHGHYVAAGAVNWLRGYTAEYQRLKARAGMLDFDDLLLRARDLLRDRRDVRDYFQGRFRAILVDEFQDTDPLQAEIMFFLAEDGPRAAAWDQVRLSPGKLFLVGDPKQSIYAFRRADIETYERAKDVLLRSGDLLYITANFRSVRPVLDAVNQTFSGKMRRPPDGGYQPDYVALEPSCRTRTPERPALTLLYSGDDDDADDLNATRLRRREAAALAAFLRRAVEECRWQIGEDRRPVRFGDVALLFRGMADVPVYEEALKAYDIPYRVTSSRTFYRREEIGWLLNVLHAVEHPTDAVAVWGSLRSPVFGCSDRDIYAYVSAGGALDYRRTAMDNGPERIVSAFAILRELHGERLRTSVPRMVERVLTRTDARAIFLLMPQGEQRAANLTKVVSLAAALEATGVLTFRAFVRWLRDMEEQAVDEGESPTVEDGDDVVRLMSIHAAKGLEFPIVVIPDLARAPGGGADHLLADRTRGAVAAYVTKVGGWPVQTRDYEALKSQHGAREEAERLRVLYVAMTRARDGLVIPVFPKTQKGSLQEDLEPDFPKTPTFGALHNGWLVVDGRPIVEAFPGHGRPRPRVPDAATPEGDAAAEARRTWLGHREAASQSARTADPIVTPSSLIDHDALVALQRSGAALETEPGGRKLGDLVHRVLSLLPLHRPGLVEPLVRYVADQQGLSEPIRLRAVDLVRSALALDSSRAALSASHWREVPFATAGPRGVVEGVIDLVAEGAEGVTVLDYKTDTLPAGAAEEAARLYAPQLDAYAAAVSAAAAKPVKTQVLFLSRGAADRS